MQKPYEKYEQVHNFINGYIIEFLSGYKVIEGLATLEDGAMICLNAAAVMTGAFPLIYVVSKLLTKPLKALGKAMGINETSAMKLFSKHYCIMRKNAV